MIKIQVCIGSACHLKGSYNVITGLQELIELHDLGDRVEIEAVFCLGYCTKAVSIKIDDDEVESVSGQTVLAFFTERILPVAALAE